MDNVLIETDVLLDFFFDRQPFAKFATEVLNNCEEKKIKGLGAARALKWQGIKLFIV